MPIVQLQKQNFDTISLKAFSSRNFLSGSSLCLNTPIGESGCVAAVSSRSKCIKDIDNNADSITTRFVLNDSILNRGKHSGREYLRVKSNENFSQLLDSPSEGYHWKINRNSIKYEAPEPSVEDDVNSSTSYTKKSFIKNNLYHFYKSMSSNLNDYTYGFSNYNSLNFFTLGVPSGFINPDKTHRTCLIYKNTASCYTPEKIENNFTFECWINPKRSNISNYDYNYGTIIHIPYLIGVYLTKGSSKDEFGHVDKFRIQAQFGSESISLPDSSLLSQVTAYHDSKKIITEDNCLNKNSWHHLSIVCDNGSVTIYVDGNEVFDNSVSHSIEFPADIHNSVVTIGNRFKDTTDDFWNANKNNLLNYYFGTDIVEEYALTNTAAGTRDSAPNSLSPSEAFDNDLDTSSSTSLALNAEINDIRLYKDSRLKTQILLDRTKFVESILTPEHENLIFYVPVYYVPEKISRKGFITAGPRQTITYSSPVNPFLSHRIIGHEVSVEHFVKELIKNYRPYINGIHDDTYVGESPFTGSYTETFNFNEKLCNLFLSDDTTTKDRRQDNLLLRNYLILPCDNGLTRPGWQLISEKYSDVKDFVFSKDIFGNQTDGIVSVHSLLDFEKDDINKDGLTGPRVTSGINNSIYRQDRTVDSSSDIERHVLVDSRLNEFARNIMPNFLNTRGLSINRISRFLPFYEVTGDSGELYSCHFDISNAFYSSTIKKESLTIEDRDLHGTAGALSIKLKDNENGQIYRSDSLTTPAKWNVVGHVFYREGILNVLHPGLSTFGSISYEMDFKSTQDVNVFEINVPCEEGTLNVSHNKSFKKINPSDSFADKNKDFVFIDTINLHDENLNIVAKANLSKPLSKRLADKYNFRLKLDY